MSEDMETPWLSARAFSWRNCSTLEQVPEELVIDIVMVLHLGSLHKSPEQARAAVGSSLFQIGVAALHIFAEKFGGPLGFAEVRQRVINIVGQVALGLAQILNL